MTKRIFNKNAKKRGDTWEKWRDRELGVPYMIWHDGFPFEYFDRIKKEDREHVMNMVLEGVEMDDPSAIEALGFLGAEGQVKMLRKKLDTLNGATRVKLAVTLHKADPKRAEEYADAILDVVYTPMGWVHRMEAVIELRNFDLPKVRKALKDVKKHEQNDLVKHHAIESLEFLENKKNPKSS